MSCECHIRIPVVEDFVWFSAWGFLRQIRDPNAPNVTVVPDLQTDETRLEHREGYDLVKPDKPGVFTGPA